MNSAVEELTAEQERGYLSKVFILKGNGQWDEKGTGYARLVGGVGHDPSRILVSTGHGSDLLVDVPIVQSDRFSRQGETMITWDCSSTGDEMALSFRNDTGCRAIWSGISSIVRAPGGIPSAGPDESLIDDSEDLDVDQSFENDAAVVETEAANDDDDLDRIEDIDEIDRIDEEYLDDADDDGLVGPRLPLLQQRWGDDHHSLPPSTDTPRFVKASSLDMHQQQGATYSHGNGNGRPLSPPPPVPGKPDSMPFSPVSSASEAHSEHPPPELNLPAKPDLSNIRAIEEAISACSKARKDEIVSKLTAHNARYLRSLLDVLMDAEDLEDNDALLEFNKLIHTLMALNDSLLFETLVSDELFGYVVGCFEHSPDQRLANQRHMLRNRLTFREVVPINDEGLRARIHQNFRLQIIKDCLLPRNFDEAVLQTLNSSLYFNQTEILSGVLRRKKFMNDICAMIKDHYTSECNAATQFADRLARMRRRREARQPANGTLDLPAWAASSLQEEQAEEAECYPGKLGGREQALMFLMELFNMVKTFHPEQKPSMLSALAQQQSVSFYSLFQPVLADRHATVREVACALEILTLLAQTDIQSIRRHCLSQKPTKAVIPGIGQQAPSPPSEPVVMVSEENEGVADSQLYALITDPDNLVDDHHSIRLYEKLYSLYEAGELVVRGPSVDEARNELMHWNEHRLPHGEHGLLVKNVDRSSSLLHLIVWRIVDDPDPSLVLTATELLKLVLDATTGDAPERDALLTEFYDHYVAWLGQPFINTAACPAWLVAPVPPAAAMKSLQDLLTSASSASLDREPPQTASLSSNTTIFSPSSNGQSAAPAVDVTRVPPDALRRQVVDKLAPGFGARVLGRESSISKSSKYHISEFLCHAAVNHGYRMKYFVLRTAAILKAMRMLRYAEKHLQLVVVRFVKACIGVTDPFYARSFVNYHVFSPFVALFLLNINGRNLVNSAILDTFECIRHTKQKLLIDYLAEHFEPLLGSIHYVDTFRVLLILGGKIRGELPPAPAPLALKDLSRQKSPVLGVGGLGLSGSGRQGVMTDPIDDAYFEGDEVSNGDSSYEDDHDHLVDDSVAARRSRAGNVTLNGLSAKKVHRLPPLPLGNAAKKGTPGSGDSPPRHIKTDEFDFDGEDLSPNRPPHGYVLERGNTEPVRSASRASASHPSNLSSANHSPSVDVYDDLVDREAFLTRLGKRKGLDDLGDSSQSQLMNPISDAPNQVSSNARSTPPRALHGRNTKMMVVLKGLPPSERVGNQLVEYDDDAGSGAASRHEATDIDVERLGENTAWVTSSAPQAA